MPLIKYLPPESSGEQEKIPDLDDLNPVLVMNSHLTLQRGCLLHVVENSKGLIAHGILAGDQLEISLKPANQSVEVFEQQLINQLEQQPEPLWLIQDPLPNKLSYLLQREISSGKIPVERILTLPLAVVLDYIVLYNAGQGASTEERIANPCNLAAVNKLINHVKHAVLCKLAVLVMKQLEFRRITAGEVRDAPGIQHDLVIECHLPVHFQGTVIDLETSGLDPVKANLVAVGFLTGNTAWVFFNTSNSPEFLQLVTDYVKQAQGPLAAYNKRFEEKWLGTDFDFELMINREPKYRLFRNLTDGFNRGEGKNVPSWWKKYLDAGNTADRELWKRNIACHNLSCVLLEDLLLFINAREQWRVTAPNELSLLIDKAARRPNNPVVANMSNNLDQVHVHLTFDPIVTPDVPLLPSNNDLAVTVNRSNIL